MKQNDSIEKQIKKLEEKLDKHEVSSQKRYAALEKLMELKMNLRFEQEEEKTNGLINKFKDIILTAIDPLLQELETRRLDREIASDQMLKVRDEIDNHEKRIKKLEQS